MINLVFVPRDTLAMGHVTAMATGLRDCPIRFLQDGVQICIAIPVDLGSVSRGEP